MLFSVPNDTSLDPINIFSTRKPIENITVCLKHNCYNLSNYNEYYKSYSTNNYLRPIKRCNITKTLVLTGTIYMYSKRFG